MQTKLKERMGAWGLQIGYLLVDTTVMAGAYLTAFILRFDFHEPWWGWTRVALSFVTVWVVQSLSLAMFGCYRLLWRYLTISDVPRFMGAMILSTGVFVGLRVFFPSAIGFRPPFSITFFNSFLATSGLLGVRLLWRLFVEGHNGRWNNGGKLGPVTGRMCRVLLVGAGSAGNMVVRELRNQTSQRLVVVGFVDDDPAKQHASIQGYTVLGKIAALPTLVRKHQIEEIIISMVRVPRDVIRRVVRLCEQAHVPVRIVPNYYELIDGSLTVSKIRNVAVEDLLGRVEQALDNKAAVETFGCQRVLVTGAGGSIGSELVRQILRVGPELLVLVERSENALYEMDREIRALGLSTPVVTFLADIGDRQRMTEILAHYRPNLLLHAAAHKHVPLMEQNPIEAVKNNVLASRLLGELAVAHGVERFVLISTDKAVNPVSIMGITKRLAEIALQDLNSQGGTRFSAVRFGNVLDSSGSVVPLFREQIRKGGPVTVTHPEMKRYFMTISEAVALVLQAAALAQGGEIFVLDMGEPIKIVELAEEMIALSGLKPHEEIPIVFTGVRPGEKLFEELDVSERSTYKTGHARIFVSKIPVATAGEVRTMLITCQEAVDSGVDAQCVHKKVRHWASNFEKKEA